MSGAEDPVQELGMLLQSMIRPRGGYRTHDTDFTTTQRGHQCTLRVKWPEGSGFTVSGGVWKSKREAKADAARQALQHPNLHSCKPSAAASGEFREIWETATNRFLERVVARQSSMQSSKSLLFEFVNRLCMSGCVFDDAVVNVEDEHYAYHTKGGATVAPQFRATASVKICPDKSQGGYILAEADNEGTVITEGGPAASKKAAEEQACSALFRKLVGDGANKADVLEALDAIEKRARMRHVSSAWPRGDFENVDCQDGHRRKAERSRSPHRACQRPAAERRQPRSSSFDPPRPRPAPTLSPPPLLPVKADKSTRESDDFESLAEVLSQMTVESGEIDP